MLKELAVGTTGKINEKELPKALLELVFRHKPILITILGISCIVQKSFLFYIFTKNKHKNIN